MVDITEVDIITTVEIDIDLDTIITMVTDIIMVDVTEHNPDGMDIIGIEMTTITVVDIEITEETTTTIETVVITIVEVIITTEIVVIITTETVVITTELPDHVQQVDSIDRSFYGLSSFMRGSIQQ